MDRWDTQQDVVDPTPVSWLKFGQRNILYIGFLTLLVPLGLALDGPRPPGAAAPGGIAFATMLCGAVSAGFFALNASLFVSGLVRGRGIAKAAIGCLLPAVFGVCAVLARGYVL